MEPLSPRVCPTWSGEVLDPQPQYFNGNHRYGPPAYGPCFDCGHDRHKHSKAEAPR
jgi:hypothetical protein